MKKSYYFIFAVLAMMIISCGGSKVKSGTPAATLELLKTYQQNGELEKARELYTKDTLKAMDAIEKICTKEYSGSKVHDNMFDQAEREILSEEISGDTAIVKVKFTHHPIENMNGFEYVYRFRKEEGIWKLDMEKEFKASSEIMKKIK